MLGGWEWVIILIIVILIFGVGRIGKLGSEMGKGIRAFRDGLQGDEPDDGAPKTKPNKDSEPD
ncbi:MAG: twin-arginine translocase TatA/TatE family subunit [Chloroflexi bacterium]|nr:twin-arginine translocase TatA/TatE family subunit [Chloroflexota bacterium]MBK6708814.1 twin-arginine translocase TatA/TatE family subunit [Chloroflexota bacterium]MBK7179237.1 twin-arginine translocase TatA/TatE family subunit [Chloroflexota bacterium]MBK7917170.1 twin-arginine translocase TatA/TatE family subunit [Chloroflexota bacterium]MBK8934391.1 twin-arginine translocase TatA/TatE family subunit [Chloroflexota bacterium]